jgi:hypothetical protein
VDSFPEAKALVACSVVLDYRRRGFCLCQRWFHFDGTLGQQGARSQLGLSGTLKPR